MNVFGRIMCDVKVKREGGVMEVGLEMGMGRGKEVKRKVGWKMVGFGRLCFGEFEMKKEVRKR